MGKKLKDHSVSSFPELHEVLERYRHGRWLFRGHSSVQWRLVPKAGRPPFAEANDAGVFKAWKRRAVELIDIRPDNDWDWLALAQHHGLATRLLDWSTNPLAAAFFSVHAPADEDAAIYAYFSRWIAKPDAVHPMDCEGVVQVRPSAVARRISRQGGQFTIHGPPVEPLDKNLRDGEALERIIIRKEYRAKLLFELDHYGINKLSLFHDLDGLSEYLNWNMIHREHWTELPDASHWPAELLHDIKEAELDLTTGAPLEITPSGIKRQPKKKPRPKKFKAPKRTR